MKAFLVVAAVAVLFVLGPVLAMRPSPRQKQLARLRQAAIAAGLRVRVGDKPAAARAAGSAAVCYGLAWPAADLERVRGSELRAERTAEGGWRVEVLRGQAPASGNNDALGSPLALMPVGVSTVIASGSGVAAYWDERGTDADVQRIAQALRGIAEAWKNCLESGVGARAQSRH